MFKYLGFVLLGGVYDLFTGLFKLEECYSNMIHFLLGATQMIRSVLFEC